MTALDGSVALTPEPGDDEAAAALLKAQHDAEWAVFAETNYYTVKRVLRSRCAQTQMVEDALNEAFLHARVKWSQVRDHQRPVGWVITTARRKLGREQERALREAAMAPDELPPMPSPQSGGLDAWGARELVDRWMARLTTRQAEVFQMSRDGFSDHEIAVFLGIAESSVVSYRSAAVSKLRLLAEDEGYRSKNGGRRQGGDDGLR